MFKSAYTKHLESEVDRLRNENRILLSALLERAVSREAALMLRKPEELSLSLQNMKDRARVHYEATRESKVALAPEDAGKPIREMDLRHWRGARAELETQSAREHDGEHSNDSVERIEAKVRAAQGA